MSTVTPQVKQLSPEEKRALLASLLKKKKAARPKVFPASFAQQRLWFLDRLYGGDPLYNIPFAVRLEGALDVAAFRRALGEVVRRHEALRTTFADEDGRPVQVIAPPSALPMPLVDLSGLTPAQRETVTLRLAAAEGRRLFDLARGPVLRCTVLRLSAEEHVALLTVHHIVSDGWSKDILLREMSALYGAYAGGEESPLAELPLQYADFAVWQRDWLQGETLEKQLSYWREHLAGAPPVLELPTDRPRPAFETHRGATHSFRIDAALYEELKELSRREGATLFMTLLAAFQALLARYSGQSDVVVGTVIAGRNRAETEGLIGFFVNTLALRARVSGDPTFIELLARSRAACLGAYAHQDVPFEKLVEELKPERRLGHTPLFQVTCVLQNTPQSGAQLTGVRMRGLGAAMPNAKFDLMLTLVEGGHDLGGSLTYKTDLFDPSTIERMAEHFRVLLAAVVARPDARLSELPLLTDEERRRLLVTFNDTARDYPADDSVHSLFEQQAARTPGADALVCEGETLSYAELDARANRLARHLRRRGVSSESRVAVMLGRTARLPVALLAVLKAGAAYVPLDPEYPEERLRFMLADSGARLLLTESSLLGVLAAREGEQTSPPAQALCLDLLDDELAAEEETAPAPLSAPSMLSHVIYTSGSTGRPKGVMITHASTCQMLRWARDSFSDEELSGVLFSTSVCFDLSVFELFAPLSWGGTAVLAENALALPRLDARGRVRLVNTVPSAMAELLRGGGLPEGVVTVNLAGEPLPVRLARGLYAAGVGRVCNLYGPTEDTTYSTWCEVGQGGVSLGRPLPNTRAYVLDAGGGAVPAGVAGELYLGGAGLARGYLSRPALTAERFVPDPFSEVPGARLYRTGDIVKHLADGRLEYLGRADHQVKVRGFRVELGEVEAALCGHARVREAAVAAAGEGGQRRLVAYVVADGAPDELSVGELRRHLLERLPEHMVPSLFVFMDALPLTPNGKLDRKSLPEPEAARREPGREYVAPRTPVEEMLCEMWAEVLGVERVGIQDDFFELGGHSLLATQLVSRVRAAFGVELPLRSLFETPNVEGEATEIEVALRGGRGGQAPPVVRVPRDRELPLSFAQQRLWFIEQLGPGASAYNMPFALRLTGRLDAPALQRAVGEVVRRHEVLRTRFVTKEGLPVPHVEQDAPAALPLVDLGGAGEDAREAEARRLTRAESRRPFHLDSDTPLRGRLLRLSADEHILLLTMHHIAGDAWSVGVLTREISTLYEAYSRGEESPLAELPVQYADYAAWQRDWLRGEALDRQLSYWRQQLAGVPVLELPTDRPRPAALTHRGAYVTADLPHELLDGLRQLSRREGATLFMTLLAAFQSLLARYSGQSDVVVGMPIAGRNRAETEGLIGLFVNTLALRVSLSPREGFRQLLKRVRETCLGAYAHQDVPFEKLVEELQPERSLNHTPLFQVMFGLQNTGIGGGGLTLPGLSWRALEGEGGSAKFDLTLTAVEGEEKLMLVFNYNTDLFDAATVERMSAHFQTLLQGVVAKPDARFTELPLLTDEERHRLVVEFNDTARDYPTSLAHELFEQHAASTPEAVALVVVGGRLTYVELDSRADDLARRLRRLGVGPESKVAILLERSAQMVVSLLAVLKAGGCYVPLDPAYPSERLRFMLADSGARVLLTDSLLRERLPDETAAHTLCLDAPDDSADADAAPTDEGGAPVPGPDALAYVIYTSGSTGTPKGVMVTHAGLSNYLRWAREAYGVGPGRGAPVHSPLGFDLTVTSLLLPLCAGASVTLLPEGPGVEHLAAALSSPGGYGLVKLTPAHLEALSHALDPEAAGGAAEVLVVGGEALTGSMLAWWGEHAPLTKVVNEYGPTETVVGCCVEQVRAGEVTRGGVGAVPIGRPIANTRLYVLGCHGEVVPAGAAGELYIGGAGVARGYLSRPALTAEKFVPDPFSRDPGARLYRTGDVVKHLPDGKLEYLGRADHQVKVRGHRIELGEVEAVICRHERVAEAAVVAREVGGSKQLVAYFVAGPDGDAAGVGETELRRYLAGRLPEYMVPSLFVRLDALPLTPNGKLDRKALPEPGARARVESLVPPRNAVELRLARVWEEVLGLGRVGIKDNFFHAGGHSLLAVQLVTRVEKEFGRRLPLSTLYQGATVEDMAVRLGRGADAAHGSLVGLREGGAASPFFCVHPAGGNVFCYVELADRLGAGRPFYGLQARGLDGGACHTSVEEMAAHYVGEMRAVQPGGPYLLGGWSLGGVVAFEMARQLEAQGQRVGLLALLDSYVPRPSAEDEDEAARLLSFARHTGLDPARLGVSREQVARLDGGERLGHVLELAKAADLLPPDIGLGHVSRLWEVFEANLVAARTYTPGAYAGRVTLFKAGGGVAGRDAAAEWGPLAAGGVEVLDVPGDHFSFVREPHVGALAGALASCLERAAEA